MNEITQEKLMEYMAYTPDTGEFVRVKAFPGVKIGQIAGTLTNDGYRFIAIEGKRYSAGRLAWLYVHGYLPENYIDHIDGKRDNNRINNLREATPAENSQNQSKPRHNRSGIVGVSWSRRTNKWVAHISVKGKSKHIGYFLTIKDAAKARSDAKAELHKFNPEVRN